jgi:hypothetical protein
MLREIDAFYLAKEEPVQSCLLALREIILSQDKNITPEWKYKMPFFSYKGKMFCYLWFHKKFLKPYIGVVEGKLIHHPDLLAEKRSRMKILLIDPFVDIPLEKVIFIIQQSLKLYR